MDILVLVPHSGAIDRVWTAWVTTRPLYRADQVDLFAIMDPKVVDPRVWHPLGMAIPPGLRAHLGSVERTWLVRVVDQLKESCVMQNGSRAECNMTELLEAQADDPIRF